MKPLNEKSKDHREKGTFQYKCYPEEDLKEALKNTLKNLPEDNSEMTEEYQIGFNEAIKKFKNKLEKHLGKELLE